MKENSIKLIISDIDDTLIHKEIHLDQETIVLINEVKKRGIQFTLATGRMPFRAAAFIEDAKLEIPMIANNGSILCHENEVIFCEMLDANIFKDVLRKYMEKYPNFTVMYSYQDKECPVTRTKWIEDRLNKYVGYNETLGDTDEVWNQKVHKVYVIDDDRRGFIGELAKELQCLDGEFSFFQYGEYSIEIVASGCTKASGLKKLLNILEIKPEEVMAIGDHTNDIEMLKFVGIGVAVANAAPQVKEVADYIAKEERSKGVAEAIKKYIFLEG